MTGWTTDVWIEDRVRSHNMKGLCFYRPLTSEKGEYVTAHPNGKDFSVEIGVYEGSCGTHPNDIVESCFTQKFQHKFGTMEEVIQFIEENLGCKVQKEER